MNLLKKHFRSGVVAVVILSFLSTVFISSSGASTPGELDASFDTDGKVTTAIGTNIAEALSVVMDSNGKIVVAGYAYNGSNHDFAVARYNSDGTLDTSFSTDGIVTTPIGTGLDAATSIAIDNSGKIVVAGYVQDGASSPLAVVRYLSDGTLDTSFGTGGKVTTSVGVGLTYAFGIVIDSNGKIVVAGSSENAFNEDITVVRYNSDGDLDTTFSADGIVTTSGIGGDSDQARALAIDANGKIVIAGHSSNGVDFDFAAARYNSDGTLDTSFGIGGIVTTPVGVGMDFGQSLAIDGSGKIVVAGYSNNGTDYDFAVVRYNSNGTLDSSFGTLGKVTTAIGTDSELAFDVAIDGNGKIVVAGYSIFATIEDIAVVRYNSNGTLDSSFGTGGKLTTDIGGGSDQARSLTIDSNGKIVVVGSSQTGFIYKFAVMRYNVLDSAAIAAEAARVAAAAEAARVAAAAEAARAAIAAEAAKKAQEQKELLAILGLLPPIGGISVDIGNLANTLLFKQKCVKGKTIKYVKKGSLCPKGYVKKK
jgi:uncharacterized delta-60 repeat protein